VGGARRPLRGVVGEWVCGVTHPGPPHPPPPLDDARPPHHRLISDLPNGRHASLLDDNVPRGKDAVRPVACQDIGTPDHDALALPAPATTRLLHTSPRTLVPQVCPYRACDAPHHPPCGRRAGCPSHASTR